MEKILVPTDFSDKSQYALDFAAQLARKNNAQIHLVNVIEHPHGGSFNSTGTVAQPDDEEQLFILALMRRNRERLQEMLSQEQYEGIDIKSEVEVGRSFNTITNKLAEHECNLIVMGTHGTSGLEETLIGSNAERVIRHADCPVITLKEHVELDTIDHIAFATDLHAEGNTLTNKIKLLQAATGAKLHLVRINTPNNFVRDADTLKHMEAYAAKYSLENYEFHIYNDVSEEDGIHSFAEAHDMDLIAMSTHGRTGIFHLISGSIAEGVVNHAKRPVWTLKVR